MTIPSAPQAALPQLPPAIPPPPIPSTPAGQKPGTKSQQPSFLSGGALPNKSQVGTKTLVGQ